MPPGVITVISTVPFPGGLLTTIFALRSTVIVPSLVPNLTKTGPSRRVPVIVTRVPPPVDPLAGDSPVTAGAVDGGGVEPGGGLSGTGCVGAAIGALFALGLNQTLAPYSPADTTRVVPATARAALSNRVRRRWAEVLQMPEVRQVLKVRGFLDSLVQLEVLHAEALHAGRRAERPQRRQQQRRLAQVRMPALLPVRAVRADGRRAERGDEGRPVGRPTLGFLGHPGLDQRPQRLGHRPQVDGLEQVLVHHPLGGLPTNGGRPVRHS